MYLTSKMSWASQSGEMPGLWNQTYTGKLALTPTSCVILGKTLKFSKVPLPYL